MHNIAPESVSVRRTCYMLLQVLRAEAAAAHGADQFTSHSESMLLLQVGALYLHLFVCHLGASWAHSNHDFSVMPHCLSHPAFC